LPIQILSISWRDFDMHVVTKICRWIVQAAASSLALASMASAQVPSADQLSIFQNLSTEQQQAIMQQMGGGQSRDAGSSSSATGTTSGSQGTNADAQRRRVGEELEPQVPTLKEGDTVVIEISLPGDPASQQAKAAAQAQALAQAQAQLQLSGNPQSPNARAAAAEDVAEQRRQRLVAALDQAGHKRLEELVRLVLSRNPYQLDRNAQLNLPGFAPIALGGLTEEQAIQRLSLEPVLLPLQVNLNRLPLAKTGVAGLKPFGYDLFDNAPSTFAPVTDVPVPADYVIGTGDGLRVQLFGSQNRSLPLTVNRDGSINFPELGPIRVAGMTFNAVRQLIEARVSQQMIGVQASVSMGDTRSIRVFVLGEARLPGSYTVSGLSTMTAALFASGGV
jgi:hypothetical protein